MQFNYVCDSCGNTVVLDQEYLDYAGWQEGDEPLKPQCKCLAMLTLVE